MLHSPRRQALVLALALFGSLASCSPYEPDPTPIPTPRVFGEWRWQNPQPQGQTLTGVWGASADRVWAVGSGGAMILREGGGWREVSHGLGRIEFIGIWGRSGEDVTAVGSGGEILQYDGSRWSLTPTPDGAQDALFNGIAGTPDGVLWICGTGGTLLRRAELGWESIPDAPPGNLVALAVDPEGTVYVADSGADVHVLEDGAWSTLPVVAPLQVVLDLAVDSEGLLACGASGVARYRAGDWDVLDLPEGWPSYTPLYCLEPTPNGDLLVTGGLGFLATLEGDELTVDTLVQPLPADLLATWPAPGGEAFAVGTYGVLAHREGGTWRIDVESAAASDCGFGPQLECGWPAFVDMRIVAADLGFAIHTEGLARYDGETWSNETIDVSTAGSLVTLWADDSGHLLVGGEHGLLENLAGDWRMHPASFEARRSQLWASASTDAWWPGRDGELFHFDGSAVTSTPGPDGRGVTAVHGDGAGALWVLVRQQHLYRGVPGAWTLVDTREAQDGLLQRLTPGPNGMLAVGSHLVVAVDGSGFGDVEFESDTLIDDLWTNGTELFVLQANGTVSHQTDGVWRAAPGVSRGFGARHLCGWEDQSLFLAGDAARILRLQR